MPFTPLINNVSPPRASAASKFFSYQILRDQFSLSTWLLIGAAAQSILYLLPIRPTFVVLPAFFVLLLKLADTVLITLNLKANPYIADTIDSKFTALIPNSDGSFGAPKTNADESNDKIAVVILGFTSNHPLGIFAPGAREIGGFFESMVKDLSANATTNGFLGSNSFLGDPGSRATKSEIMTTFYFRTLDDVQTFAHGSGHREGWNWWSKTKAQHRHLAIMHEVYEAPKGRFENVYDQMRPKGAAGLSFPVIDKEGYGKEVVGWTSPVVSAAKGKLASAIGRTKAYE